MRTYQEIEKAVKDKGYKWYTGAYNLNCVWERTSDVFTNKFTDWFHIAYQSVDGGQGFVFTIPATTKAGLKGSVLEPVTVEGITGTAVIKPGQYLSAWEFHDTYKEFSSYPYFRQIGKVDYWRDGDKDTEIDKVNDQEDRVFGTHWHRMSQNDTYGSGLVNNWSKGCLGASEPEWEKILPIVKKCVNKYGTKFTGTLLETKDFK